MYIKMSKHSWAKYYEDNEERLQSKVLKDTKVFLKKKKQHYGGKRYKYLPENEKQKLAEYRKKYYKMRKIALL